MYAPTDTGFQAKISAAMGAQSVRGRKMHFPDCSHPPIMLYSPPVDKATKNQKYHNYES